MADRRNQPLGVTVKWKWRHRSICRPQSLTDIILELLYYLFYTVSKVIQVFLFGWKVPFEDFRWVFWGIFEVKLNFVTVWPIKCTLLANNSSFDVNRTQKLIKPLTRGVEPRKNRKRKSLYFIHPPNGPHRTDHRKHWRGRFSSQLQSSISSLVIIDWRVSALSPEDRGRLLAIFTGKA